MDLLGKIFLDGSVEDYRMKEYKRINFFRLYLDVVDKFDKEKVIERIKSSLGAISKIREVKKKFSDMEIEKLVSASKTSGQIKIVDREVPIRDICETLDISPSKFKDNPDLFNKIEKLSNALAGTELNFDKKIEKLFSLCDKVLDKESFLDKMTITSREIISENNLTDDDVYFTHSSRLRDLDFDSIKFEYDETIRGERSENTPEHIYGFYLTDWKSGEDQDYDAWHYIDRVCQASGFFNKKAVNLYVVKLKDDAKFLRSNISGFRQTNESTKEFAEFCKSLGLSGYYHPNVYSDKSALEIVLVDKSVISNIKKDDEAKDRIIEAEKK